MDINGVSTRNNSGLERVGNESVTLPQVSKIRPRETNIVDIGSATKRVKNIFYQSLDPVPGGAVGGYLALDGSTTMSGDIKVNITNVGSLSGGTNNRSADNIVSNSGSFCDKHSSVRRYF